MSQAIEFETSHDDRYREAQEIACAQGATMFELRSSLSLTEVNVREGRAAARDVLARIPEPEPWPEVVAAQSL